jgi:hypothetical protein
MLEDAFRAGIMNELPVGDEAFQHRNLAPRAETLGNIGEAGMRGIGPIVLGRGHREDSPLEAPTLSTRGHAKPMVSDRRDERRLHGSGDRFAATAGRGPVPARKRNWTAAATCSIVRGHSATSTLTWR